MCGDFWAAAGRKPRKMKSVPLRPPRCTYLVVVPISSCTYQ